MKVARATGRPAGGFGHYLRDLVYGALDGVITTLAVVAATAGAALAPRVGIILGLANLVADGISMGASNYLGIKSAIQQEAGSVKAEAPWRHGLATLVAFVMVGSVPLLGYVLAPRTGAPTLAVTAVLSLAALLVAGAVRAPFVRRRVLASAAEMAVIGAVAGAAAYGVGLAAQRLLGP